jgi:hypothetical protein
MNPIKKYPNAIILAVALITALASCATKPAPVPEPEPAPIVQPAPEPEPAPIPTPPAVTQDELDGLLARAQDLKKRAFDLGLGEFLPADYKAANEGFAASFALYSVQEGGRTKDAPTVRDSLTASIKAYDDLIARGLVALAGAKKKSADEARAGALKVAADSKTPERWNPAEQAYGKAAALVAEGKHEEAAAAFARARAMYELAYKRSIAGGLRAERDFAKWDAGNSQLADNKYSSEEGLWAAGADVDLASGIDALDEAILRYNLVIQKGREFAAAAAKEKSDGARSRSDEIKAKVAVKDLYDAALSIHEAAATKLGSGDFDGAAEEFTLAAASFDRAYAAAAEKRAAAQAAMAAADEASAESARKADEAESLVTQPGTP